MKTINDYAELVKAEHAMNKTIAPVEDGANIAGSYTSGKQFIRGGVLYTALTTIAANTAWSSLTLDTDYEVADDLTTQLASVNQTLTNNKLEKVIISDISQIPNNDIKDLEDGVYTIILGVITNPNLLNAPPISSGVQLLITTASTGFRYLNCSPYNNGLPNYFGGLAPNGVSIDWRPVVVTSNRNLLDNPWFTVNQRGQSSFPSVNYAYWIDRWKLLGQNSETIGRTIILDDGINVSADTGSTAGDIIFQVLEPERFQFEKVYTLSVMLDDGNVYSVSGILPTPDGTYKVPIFTNISGKLQIRITEETNKRIGVIASALKDNESFKIKAMKLELGSVSTLAQDTAPNYAEELAKCKASTADSSDTYANQGQIVVAKPVTLDNSIVTSTAGTVDAGNTKLTRWGNLLEFKLSVTGLTITANTWTTIAEIAGLNEDVAVLMTAIANDSTFGVASVEKGTNKIIIKVKFTTAITNGFVLVYGNTILD